MLTKQNNSGNKLDDSAGRVAASILQGAVPKGHVERFLSHESLGRKVVELLRDMVSNGLENGQRQNALSAISMWARVEKSTTDFDKLGIVSAKSITSEFLDALSVEEICNVLFSIDPNVPKGADGEGAPERKNNPEKFAAILGKAAELQNTAELQKKKAKGADKHEDDEELPNKPIIGAYFAHYVEQILAAFEKTVNPIPKCSEDVLGRMSDADWKEAAGTIEKLAIEKETRGMFESFITLAIKRKKLDSVVDALAKNISERAYGRFYPESDEYILNHLNNSSIRTIVNIHLRAAKIPDEYWPISRHKLGCDAHINVFKGDGKKPYFVFNEGDSIQIEIENPRRLVRGKLVGSIGYSCCVTVHGELNGRENPMYPIKIDKTQKTAVFEGDLSCTVQKVLLATIEVSATYNVKHGERLIKRTSDAKMTVLIIPGGEELILDSDIVGTVIDFVAAGRITPKEAAEALERTTPELGSREYYKTLGEIASAAGEENRGGRAAREILDAAGLAAGNEGRSELL